MLLLERGQETTIHTTQQFQFNCHDQISNYLSNLMMLSTRSPSHFLKFYLVFRRFRHAISSKFSLPNQNLNWKQPTQNLIHASDLNYNKPISSNIYNCNIMISNLGRDRKVKEAKNVFDKMPQRDIVSYTSMISVYLKNGDLLNAEKLFDEVPQRNVVVNSAMIDAYAKARRMEEARRIFDEMPERNVFSWTCLISGYFRIGNIDEARKLFDEMPERNVVSWTTMVSGYARNGFIAESREFFDQMPEKNVVAWTSMIKCYVNNSQIDEALKLFDEMPFRNLYSWNIMLSGYFECNRVDEAIEFFRLMHNRNEVSWTIMVTGLARNKLTGFAREYFNQMPRKDIAAWNAMITAYVDEGLMVEASELFSSMPERNRVTWNAIIDGYARNGPECEALKHLNLMRRACYIPNETTITSVLTACETMKELMQVHGLVISLGLESETSVSNGTVTMYSKTGDLRAAQVMFQNLETKDIVSWTAMILAYANHGYASHALQVFSRMLRSGAEPDHITFVGVLSACSHGGLVQKGKRLFDSMSRYSGLEPKAEHYSCLIDLLGRAGHVDEAIKVMNQMPSEERDGTVLGTLLGACKLHGNVGVANQIGEELMEMEPNSSGNYVVLANAYAADGKWDDFARVRKKMKDRKVKKVPGFSRIEVMNKSYMFFVRDRLHPQAKEIYAMLMDYLLPQMKELGYLYENPPHV